MAVKEKSESEDMEWSTEEEVQLLYALDGLKPVGINKHFYMARICERMTKALKRDIAPETVWAHLRTWYNLDVLDQMERLPFADQEVEFSLPESEFSALISKKLAETAAEEKKNVEQNVKAESTAKGKPGKKHRNFIILLYCRFIISFMCVHQLKSQHRRAVQRHDHKHRKKWKRKWSPK